MKKVYVLQHLHNLPSGGEDTKMIGVYASMGDTLAAIKSLSSQPGFKDYSKEIDADLTDEEDGFYIGKYEIGKTHWREGFVTVTGVER